MYLVTKQATVRTSLRNVKEFRNLLLKEFERNLGDNPFELPSLGLIHQLNLSHVFCVLLKLTSQIEVKEIDKKLDPRLEFARLDQVRIDYDLKQNIS